MAMPDEESCYNQNQHFIGEVTVDSSHSMRERRACAVGGYAGARERYQLSLAARRYQNGSVSVMGHAARRVTKIRVMTLR